MGFLSGLLSAGVDIATGFAADKLAQKKFKREMKVRAQVGGVTATGRPLMTARVGGVTATGPPRLIARPGFATGDVFGLPRGATGSRTVRNRKNVPLVGVGTPFPKKRRRMNPLNPRALTRALRRAEGFVKIVKRTEKALRRVSPPKKSRRTREHHHHGTGGPV
jgi:hypothetical protein